MKNNLILSEYKTETVSGLYNLNETKTYFGSKMLKIEDMICIDNRIIQYSQLYDDSITNMNGYQYVDDNYYNNEKVFIKTLTDIKNENTTFNILNKDEVYNNNVKWELIIDLNNILIEYLWLKLKENRVFKAVQPKNLINNNINVSIYDYVKLNIIDRYKFEKLDFFIKYYDIIDKKDYNTTPQLKFDIKINDDIYIDENKLNSYNISFKNDKCYLLFNQDKNFNAYRFDYYYVIYFKKI